MANINDRVHTEQLASVVDDTVSVAIQYKPGVIGFQPARASPDTIPIVVKKDRCAIHTHRFYSVVIQVDSERVPWRRTNRVIPVSIYTIGIDFTPPLGIHSTREICIPWNISRNPIEKGDF